jgi:hypothetical protein
MTDYNSILSGIYIGEQIGDILTTAYGLAINPRLQETNTLGFSPFIACLKVASALVILGISHWESGFKPNDPVMTAILSLAITGQGLVIGNNIWDILTTSSRWWIT